jgi:hypothetical protein
LQEHLADEIEELLDLQVLDSTALMKIHVDAEKAKTPERADECVSSILWSGGQGMRGAFIIFHRSQPLYHGSYSTLLVCKEAQGRIAIFTM